MRKIFLTLLFIMTFFIINNLNASYDCNKTINIDENGGNYSICGGLVTLDIPSGAVLSKTTLDINDYIKGDNINLLNSVIFENLGIGGAFDSGPGFLNFSLKDSNGNETNFKKGVKLNFKGNKNAQNIGVAFLKGNSFTFYKDNQKILIDNNGKSNESYTLSNINNYILDKNTFKMYLSDVTDINGTFSTANFLFVGGSLDYFTPISLSDQEDIKKKLNKIKELIIDKKDEILGYEKNLNILYYSFYDDEKNYNDFASIYSEIRYGLPQNKQNFDNFYNNLISKFDGIYNNLKNSSNQSLVNSGNKNIDESISELRNKINSHLDISYLYSYKYLESNLNGQVEDYKNILKYDEGKNYVNQLKNDINDRITKLTSLLNDYNSQINNSGYNTLSNYKTTDSNYSTIVNKITTINTTYENKLNNLISSFGNTDKDDLNSRINKISSLYSNLDYSYSNNNANNERFESGIKYPNIELVNYKEYYNKLNNIINSTTDKNILETAKSYKEKLNSLIIKREEKLNYYKGFKTRGELNKLFPESGNWVRIDEDFNKIFNNNVNEITGNYIRDDIYEFIFQQENSDTNSDFTDNVKPQETILNNSYQLNEKEKNAINIVANKINKMNNLKKNKYKNLLNQYLSKFESGTRKYEIVKGVIKLIK